MQTFFQVTHEIENCLNCYCLHKQNRIVTKRVELKSSDELNDICDHLTESSHRMPSEEHPSEHLDNLNSSTSDQLKSKMNRANQQVNQFDDETVCENVIPTRKAIQIKTNITQSFLNNNNSVVFNESDTVNNSNYHEINCSYTVKLNTTNCDDKNNRIIENKKPYLSASINVNNCYKSKREQQAKSGSVASDDEDETYSDATDYSDSLECPSYNFQLKNKSPNSTNNQTDLKSTQLNHQSTKSSNQPDINELIKQKLEIFNQSLINLAKCDDLIRLPNSKQENGRFEIDKLESNYLDFLEEEDLVLALCARLKALIKELIQLMRSLASDDLDETLKDVLNRNADLSSKLSLLRNETKQIENAIKNLIEKESNHKVETINHRNFLIEYKQNEERVKWLKDRIDELKFEIDLMKEEQRKFEFKDCETATKDLSTEDDEIFEDCLEHLEDANDSLDARGEVMLFDKSKFENVFKSIQQSSDQKNVLNLIDEEKFEMSTLSNKLKNEIELQRLANEELVKEKQNQLEDFTQHLNCLKKSINSNKKFLTEQIYDRDHEKDTFDTKLTRMNFLIKEKDLSLAKCGEKCDFLKSDLEELLTEKDELQCKSYNQGRKLIDVNAKRDELQQEIDRLQNENNVIFFRQEQIRKRVEEYQTNLERERLLTDKLKFDYKLELDPEFYETLEKVMNKINKFQMKEKIREHLNRRSIEKRNESIKRRCLDLQNKFTKTSNSINLNTVTPIKTASKPFSSSLRSKSFIKSTASSAPVRTNSFSSNRMPLLKVTNNDEIKLRPQSFKLPRSKSEFMNDEFGKLTMLNHRHSLKLTDESYSKFVSKLRSPNKRVLDDEDFYSFKECSSLISLNNDLTDDFSSFKSDSLFSLTSSHLQDEEMKEVDENFNSINSPLAIDAQRSLSEDTFYFSLTSEDANNECHLSDLYAELDRCTDTDLAAKLKYYAHVIANFFRQITRSINQCRDTVQSTTLDNKTKQVRVAELENTFEQLKTLVNNEAFNLERLQNELNNKHLEISELKNQIDSNQDNSLFIENKQVLHDLSTSMIENEESQFILQTNLDHLNDSLKKKSFELKDYAARLLNLTKDNDKVTEQNENLKIDNQKLEKENLELSDQLKRLREAKLYKKLNVIAKDNLVCVK